MERYFITGGAGFIGSHTVDALLKKGEQVTVFDKKSWEEAVNLVHQEGNIRYISGDIRDAEMLRDAMTGHTHVLHLAAVVSVPESIEHPIETHEVNVTGALNVFDAARICGVERVVYASSAAVYGDQRVIPIEEETPLSPRSPYGLHKKMNEEYASLYEALFGLSVMGLRYFNVYGSRQDASSPYSGVISIFSNNLKAGKDIVLHGDGSATRDFISVSMVSQANMRALQSSYSGVSNVGGGTEVSIRELLDMMVDESGKKVSPLMKESREGDIPRSCASVKRMKEVLQVTPQGLTREEVRVLLKE
jgi:UDP-glucose 4-epimerase